MCVCVCLCLCLCACACVCFVTVCFGVLAPEQTAGFDDRRTTVMMFTVKVLSVHRPAVLKLAETFPDVGPATRENLEALKEEILALYKEVSAAGSLVKDHMARQHRHHAKVRRC